MESKYLLQKGRRKNGLGQTPHQESEKADQGFAASTKEGRAPPS
jgi:hypothetical protein